MREDKRKKVIHIIPVMKHGGVETTVLSSIGVLRHKFDIRIIILGWCDPAILADMSEEDKVLVTCFNLNLKGVSFFTGLPSVIKFILQFNPDFLLTSLWWSSIVGVLTKFFSKNTTYITFIHSTVFVHLLDKVFSLLAMKFADWVFVDSSSTKKFIERYKPSEKIRIISLIRPSLPSHSTPRINTSPYRMVSIGRLSREKRLDRTIILVEKLVRWRSEVMLDIYGPDEGVKGELERLIENNGLRTKISFMGPVSSKKVRRVLSEYDFYIQLADYEGMAMSVVEAMQEGLVCLVTPVGEIPYYAEDMHTAVFLDDPFDENLEVFAGKIRKVITNEGLYHQISENARNTFRNAKTYTESVAETLEKLCAE